MTARDADTLAFYAAEASAYATRGEEASLSRLQRFAAELPSPARILELGCGAGQDSEALLAMGYDVTPSDGSPELAREAEQRLGRPVQILLFEDIAMEAAYDGIWANACLLHTPRAALPGIVGRIRAALRPGGVFYASYKAGEAEGRDRFGRFFNYPSADWLRGAYREDGWARLTIEEDIGSGYDREPTRWLHVTAVKNA